MIINYYSTFLVYIYKYIQNDLVALVVNYCSFLLRITTKKKHGNLMRSQQLGPIRRADINQMLVPIKTKKGLQRTCNL